MQTVQNNATWFELVFEGKLEIKEAISSTKESAGGTGPFVEDWELQHEYVGVYDHTRVRICT